MDKRLRAYRGLIFVVSILAAHLMTTITIFTDNKVIFLIYEAQRVFLSEKPNN